MREHDLVDLTIDRPVAGGRMLARLDGQVVLVSGTMPGERVRARIIRAPRGVWQAEVVEIVEASASRRPPPVDSECGGLSFAHIAPDEQRRLKGEIVADAFRRIARVTLDQVPAVAASPEHGYRLRARLHVRNGRAGFFRVGTHELCDAGATGQLLPDGLDATQRWLADLGDAAAAIEAVHVVENVAASMRLLHVEPVATLDAGRLSQAPLPDGVSGITMQSGARIVPVIGQRTVVDTAEALFRGDAPIDNAVQWTRRAASFFQSNRFLVGPLARRVLDLAAGDRVIDLYSGVGLFAVTLAAAGAQVLAVEGDASSGADLEANARAFKTRLRVERGSVESAVAARLNPPPDAIVLDPPRTGVSDRALRGIIGWHAARLVYVSCDPATLARDAARLLAAGYSLTSIEGFDLFPNTAHIETVAVFDR